MTLSVFMDWESSSGDLIRECVRYARGGFEITFAASQYVSIYLREAAQLNCVYHIVLFLKWHRVGQDHKQIPITFRICCSFGSAAKQPDCGRSTTLFYQSEQAFDRREVESRCFFSFKGLCHRFPTSSCVRISACELSGARSAAAGVNGLGGSDEKHDQGVERGPISGIARRVVLT